MSERDKRVQTDGVEEIPPHKWFELADKLSRVDDLLELMSKQINLTNQLLEQLIAKPYPQIPALTVNVTALPNNRYKVHTFDLSTAHTDQALGIAGTKVTHAVILQCDSACSWKRNSKTADSEDLSIDYAIDDFEMTELYVTNTALSGSLKVLVEWRE